MDSVWRTGAEANSAVGEGNRGKRISGRVANPRQASGGGEGEVRQNPEHLAGVCTNFLGKWEPPRYLAGK